MKGNDSMNEERALRREIRDITLFMKWLYMYDIQDEDRNIVYMLKMAKADLRDDIEQLQALIQ